MHHAGIAKPARPAVSSIHTSDRKYRESGPTLQLAQFGTRRCDLFGKDSKARRKISRPRSRTGAELKRFQRGQGLKVSQSGIRAKAERVVGTTVFGATLVCNCVITGVPPNLPSLRARRRPHSSR